MTVYSGFVQRHICGCLRFDAGLWRRTRHFMADYLATCGEASGGMATYLAYNVGVSGGLLAVSGGLLAASGGLLAASGGLLAASGGLLAASGGLLAASSRHMPAFWWRRDKKPYKTSVL